MNIYDFNVLDMKGKSVSLSKYKGKTLLIVNTATGCGFTPQYEGLEKLYNDYKERGFEILDFPCNQFLNQAPGSNDEIKSFCQTKYGVSFPQFSKIEVNGDNQDPLFKYLKEQKGFEGFDLNDEKGPFMADFLKKMDPNYEKNSDIKWNFTKFLVDKNGNVISRFEPTKDIPYVENELKKIL